MIDSHPEMTVLDVRTSAEYAEGHIPNAKLYPVQEIQDKLNELDKNKSYLVVCRSGSRSKAASDILAKNGFKNIYNTSGGMMQWKYELEK